MMYFASANLLALINELCSSEGTISNFLAGYCILWCIYNFALSSVVVYIGIWRTLFYLLSVRMKSFLFTTRLDFAPESYTSDGTLTSDSLF